jgi:hypothetical protein
MIHMHRTIVLVVTLLVAAPVVAVFLLVGGAALRPVAGAPTPVAEQTSCRPEPSCPQAFARPLEC